VLAALAALAAPGAALAQAVSATGTTESQGVVLVPGSLSVVEHMDFGRIARPAVAGTIVLSPTASGPTCVASAGIVHLSGCQPAHFALMGRKNWLARIRAMNGATVVLTGPGGATMTVDNLTLRIGDMVSAPGGGGGPGTFGRYRITSDTGIADFWIGGRLNIAANQAAGAYNGELEIQVIFN
jgi:hypothetical protein